MRIVVVKNNSIEPQENKTQFYIEFVGDVEDVYNNIKDYFTIGKAVLFKNKFGEILEKHNANTCIYWKGINVF